MPEPKVNHHAEIPELKASWAVPMLAWLETSAPMMVPQMSQGPDRPPPVAQSAADFTRRPDATPTPMMTSRTRTTPR